MAARSPAARSGCATATWPAWIRPRSSAPASCRCRRAGGSSATSRSRRTCARARSAASAARASARRTSACSTCSRGWPSVAISARALLSGGEQQMLAIGRALMSDPKLLLLDEPSLGLAPQLVDKIGEIIQHINEQGTSVVLVEQNAAMALKIAHHAVVLEVGAGRARAAAPRSSRPATRCASATSASPARRTIKKVTAEPIERVTTGKREPKLLAVEDVTVRFGGLEALSDVSLRRGARHHARDHRTQRRGQVDAAQRAHRRLPRERRPRDLRRRHADVAAPAADRRAGDQPHVPEPRAVPDRERAPEPAARPSPALEDGLRHRRPAAAGRAQGARRAGAHRRRHRRAVGRWPTCSTRRWARCPTACASARRWRARSAPSRTCCCSTSRWRG